MNRRACRRCGALLTLANARTYDGHWVGACRACESAMGSARVRDGTARLVLRVPSDLKDRFESAALDRDVSMNWLAAKAIEEFLDRLIPADEFSLTRRAGP